MPGSVAAAAPTEVIPYALARAFQHSREWAVDQNVYRNAEIQTLALVATSRKSWNQTQGHTAAALATLKALWIAGNGPMAVYYFYDLYETSPRLSQAGYDASGVATAGRYAVRFEGAWRETLQLGRGFVDLVLVEVS